MSNQNLLVMVHRAVHGDTAQSGAGSEQIEQGTATMARQRSDMLQASDELALDLAANADMTKAAADEVWQARFRASPALQREFRDVENYAGYMNGALAKKKKTVTPPAALTLSTAPVDDDEAAAIEAARAHGLSAAEMIPQWHARYAASPALQAEFGSREVYAAFMNAAAAGRVRICRGLVRD